MQKILIVDDRRENLLALEAILTQPELAILKAGSGSQALELLQEGNRFALILLDVRMPDPDGLATARLLRGHELAATTPIIFITAATPTPSQIASGYEAGAVDYLVSPVVATILRRKVQIFLQLDQQQRELRAALARLQESEKRLIQLAKHDPLTGLANRALFDDFQLDALTRAKRHQRLLAILYLDLDQFKDINDTLGHSAGDQLLISVGERLRQSIRASDLAARLGGDEFAVILDDIAHPEDAARVAEKIVEAMTPPHLLAGKEVRVGVSIGIATYPEAGEEAEQLLKAADTAMYHAKKSGRHNYQFFAPRMQELVLQRLHLEERLRQALQAEELNLFYQPQIAVDRQQIVAMEALLRLDHHPTFEAIGPGLFIPVAEESGLMTAMGEWVLRSACTAIQDWDRLGFAALRISIAVNVSIRELKQELFWRTIQQTIQQTGLSPERLEIELTENTVMAEPEMAITVLGQIHQLGVRITLDKFSTGNLSLRHLQRLPIDAVKLDQTLVAGIGCDPGREKLLKAIITLAHSLDWEVTAAGVERLAEVEFLRRLNCQRMQGYYFSPPVPTAAATALLQQGILPPP